MKMFENKLRELLRKSLNNQFYGCYQHAPDFILDNYDENVSRANRPVINIDPNIDLNIFLNKFDIKGLSETYEFLDDEHSRALLVRLIAFRMLGPSKIKMPLTDRSYWDAYFKINNLKRNKSIQSKNYSLELFDLKELGYNVKLFYDPVSVFIDFGLKQYEYSKDYTCKVESGDYVIDGGACFGDTALYFANEVGDEGKVFSFEFVPDNLNIFNQNIDLNPVLKKNINVIERPLWSDSTSNLFVAENGPASQVFMEEPSQYDFKVMTISIDDFVNKNKIEKIDFIKLDIEGAELECLKGAKETIKKFKPKLAICLYHDIDHFVSIPKYLKELMPEYDLFIDHYTIHLGETVLYAIPSECGSKLNKLKKTDAKMNQDIGQILSSEKFKGKEVKLHFNCDNDYYDGWINIDNNLEKNIDSLDFSWDFESLLPFDENSVDVIYDESFFDNLAIYQTSSPSVLDIYRRIIKPDGVFKLVFPNCDYRQEIILLLKSIGINNIEFFDSKAQIDFENDLFETISDDIVVIDGTFPQSVPSGFRNMEINGLMKSLDNLNSYTMFPIAPGPEAWFGHSYGVNESQFNANKEGYLKIYPENEKRLNYLYPNRKYDFKLAYSYFLAETYTFLPFYEKNEIPFVFVLYPGGAFGLNNKSSDAMLRKIFQSKYFRKVIVTQKVTLNYLLDNNFCSLDKIEYLFGGYSQYQRGESLPKKYYPKDKATIDICFVAAKYTPQGTDKGYDLFIDVAKKISSEYPFVRFHVVGGFDETDININEIKDLITFYGFKDPEFLKQIYSTMDICLSPNRPFLIYEGNFDGFPLGLDATCCQTLLFTSDELNSNDNYFEEDEIVIIKPNLEDIIKKLKLYLNDFDLLYKSSKKGQDKFYQIMSPEDRVNKVKNILLQAAETKVLV